MTRPFKKLTTQTPRILGLGKLTVKRASAILGSAIFLVVTPGTVAVYVPWMIRHWRFAPPLLGFFAFRIIGALMMIAGLPILLDSFARFAIQGWGRQRRSPRRSASSLLDCIAMCATRALLYY